MKSLKLMIYLHISDNSGCKSKLYSFFSNGFQELLTSTVS